MKTCTKCLEDKILEEFNWKNKLKGHRQSICSLCQNANSKQHYNRDKTAYIERAKLNKIAKRDFIKSQKNKPCLDCSKEYPYYVMDFDHRENKEFNISSMALKYSLKQIQEEINKCDVVCSNCHRDRTHKHRLMDD